MRVGVGGTRRDMRVWWREGERGVGVRVHVVETSTEKRVWWSGRRWRVWEGGRRSFCVCGGDEEEGEGGVDVVLPCSCCV